MKIGFVNFTPLLYSVSTPYHKPLGGSESALCYLASALANLNHQIFLFGRYQKPFIEKKVNHLPDNLYYFSQSKDIDWLIVQNTPEPVVLIKKYLGKKTKLILWLEHNIDQLPVRCLKEKNLVNLFEKIVFVSHWQKNNFIKNYRLDPEKTFVIENAIAPVFENLFPDLKILQEKTQPPVLVYTSTPFRGLDILVSLFPYLKESFPQITLKVFSSMSVYQQPQEDNRYRKLYQICQQTPGIEYLGSVSQTCLAEELKKASLLVYPNVFEETSCISVMEAMAAGCYVVTSHLGALPETTAGFASLIEMGVNINMFCDLFVKETTKILNFFTDENRQKKLEEKLKKQVVFINKNYLWSKRALQWEKLLQT